MPKRKTSEKKVDFEALFQRTFKTKNYWRQNWKNCWQITAIRFTMSSCKKSIKHAAAAQSNLDAASTMRFAASRRKTCTWQHQMTTIMQPFQCDLQPQIQETQRNTHAGTTTRCRTQRRNMEVQNNRSRNCRTHEVPFIAGCNHFTRKNTTFRASASSPKHSPCNIHAAITMRFAASCRKPARIYAHGNTRWQQSCSHSNAICAHRNNHSLQNTEEEPIHGWNAPSRTQVVPFIAGCNHFTRKNARFRAPASSTTQSPMQHSCSHYNAFCSMTWLTRMYLRTWQHQMTTIIQPLHECIVMWCQVSHHSLTAPFIECIVMWFQVSHHGLTAPFIECIVMWFQVSHHSLTPPFIECILMWFQVSHHSLTAPYIECIVMWFQVSHHSLTAPFIECIVMWFQVSHHSLTAPFIECILMWFQVSHHSLTPPFIECILMWFQVSHHSLTAPFIECIVMWFQVSHHSLTPPFIECTLMWCKVSHRPSSGKSHP